MAKSKPTAPYQQKKGGFKVGPRLAKGSYTGHTKKIKDTLIHKAQVKKQYYKDLKAEGYGDGTGSSSVGGTGSNGGALGERVEENLDDEEIPEEDEEGMDADSRPSTSKSANAKGKARSIPSSAAPTSSKSARPTTAPSKPTPTPTPAPVPAPVKRPRLTSPEIAALREKKKSERTESYKRGARGQPKLGSRVEMLLGRIKKSMA
ncbi:hypothetical protein P7C70_g1752, partial [Phenoliferia sp. Uapishka_3]